MKYNREAEGSKCRGGPLWPPYHWAGTEACPYKTLDRMDLF